MSAIVINKDELMAQGEDPFERQVNACVKALNEQLPQLAARHSGIVLMAAMAEHIGGALQMMMQQGECTPERARKLLAEIQALVFAEGVSGPSPADHRSAAAKGK
jgi:hypothetical protein